MSGCTKRATRRKALILSPAGTCSLQRVKSLKVLQECNQLSFSSFYDELDYFIDLLLSDSWGLPLGSHNLRKLCLRFSPVTPRGLSPCFFVVIDESILNELSGLIEQHLLHPCDLPSLLFFSLSLCFDALFLLHMLALPAPFFGPINN